MAAQALGSFIQMTVTGGGNDDELTRVDREPPSFPSVDNSHVDAPQAGAPPIFSSERSPITSRPLDPPPPAGSSGSGSRLRWLVAGLATILVVVLVGGALYLAAPRSGTPGLAAHYAPANTAAYFEARLDLPGDQQGNLAQFASHFPGFADQAAFQQKFDETLNSIFKQADLDWNNDIKPWFGGQVGMFGDITMAPPIATDVSLVAGAVPDQKFVVVLSVSDKAKLQSFLDAHLTSSQVSSTDYQGVQIKTIAQPGGTSMSGSYAVTDDAVVVAANLDQLKAALDANADQSKSLATDTYFLQQLGALHADRLATMYYDYGSLLASQMAPMESLSILPPECSKLMRTQTGAKYVAEVRADGDHLSFNTRSRLPSGDNAAPAPANRQTNLAQAMPGNTVAYWEMHNVGDALGWLIRNGLTCMSAQTPGGPLPSTRPGGDTDPSKIFEQLAGSKPDEYLDFIVDAAVGFSYDNDKIGVGLVATVDDEAVAQGRINKILGLLQLAGGGLGGGLGGDMGGIQISTQEIDHNGTKVNVIHVKSALAAGDDLTLQLAVAHGRLYMGVDDFVTAALDRGAAESLAANERYKNALAGGPSDPAAIGYLDVAAIADALEAKMPAQEKADFDTNTKPFLDPLSSVSLVGHVDGGIMVSNMFLFVE
jgi:hypothetical protein